MPLLSAKSLAGPGYIILNALRGMNIIGLLAVMCAAIVMLIKTKIASSFFFFDAVGHVITLIISGFLIISEASLFRGWFARNWPLLSPSHGFVALGLAMLALGITTIGNLNAEANSQADLGLAFWRIVLGAGILALILGVFNVVATFVFRDADNDITARQVRAKGAVADTRNIRNYNISYPQKAASFKTTTSASTGPPNFSAPLPQKSEAVPATPGKKNRFSRFTPRIFTAAYHDRDDNDARRAPPPPSSYYGDDDVERAREMQISGPLNRDTRFENLVPHFATVQRPDSAYHPARAYSSD